MKKRKNVHRESDQQVQEIRTVDDGGIMTITYAACYQDIVSILLTNGYYVCCHIDDGSDTMTIEYWRE